MADAIRLSNALLRPWRVSDAASLARHANNRNVSRNLRDGFPFPYTEADAREFIEIHVVPTNWAIEVAGEAVGDIVLHPRTDVLRHTAEVGYWLGEAYWGAGTMTEAVRAVTAYGVEHLSLARIDASVFARNLASARVLEKAGYHLEARLRKQFIKDGEVIDGLLYAFVRPD